MLPNKLPGCKCYKSSLNRCFIFIDELNDNKININYKIQFSYHQEIKL